MKLYMPSHMCDIKRDVSQNIQKIPKNDYRYDILHQMEMKQYDPNDGVTYVYLNINDEKDYYITYDNYEIQIQVLEYYDDCVYQVSGNVYMIV